MAATVPSPLNTFIGAGIVKWKGVDDDDFRDVGEAEMFSTQITPTKVDYFSKRTPTRRRVRSVNTQQSMTVKIRLAEIFHENLALFFMGTSAPPVSPAVYSVVHMGTVSEVLGSLRLVGTTDIGHKVQVEIPSVNLTPDGEFDFLADDWGGLEMTGEVNADAETGEFGLIYDGIVAEVTS
jgi:hypothetical protein